tara:strand:+ start:28575 stop:28964 length:390 start_codon:yes stop_codon:yes gene_type:complete
MLIMVMTGVCLTLVLALLGMQVMNMRRIRQLSEALQAATARQEALLHSSGQAIVSLNASLQALDQRVTHTARRQQELENKDSGSLTYAQASKLIQMGAGPEDLVKSCGLSQAEAKLVSLMAARGVGRTA